MNRIFPPDSHQILLMDLRAWAVIKNIRATLLQGCHQDRFIISLGDLSVRSSRKSDPGRKNATQITLPPFSGSKDPSLKDSGSLQQELSPASSSPENSRCYYQAPTK
ncbi:hypothetical protein DY000_02039695 [Brassica cretica]|uniref:Uncharacterized protein n=1 Tax=Brassica cretica TaxID=69181 RepID=A0ABQ7B4W4_BRACR|nr:hypothetical protein DY000_02039695 [Brassica cretica]